MKIERSEADMEKTPFLNDVTISLKTDGSIFEWNRSAENIFGYRAIEIVGEHVSILFSKNNFHKEKRIS